MLPAKSPATLFRYGSLVRILMTVAVAAACRAGAAGAQELEPRSYSASPVGLNFAILGFVRSTGDRTPVILDRARFW